MTWFPTYPQPCTALLESPQYLNLATEDSFLGSFPLMKKKKKVNLFTSTKNFPKPRTWLFLNFMNYSCCFNWDRSYLVFWGGIFGIGWKISSSVYWDVWRTGYIYRTVYAKKQNRVHWIGIREINTKPQSLFHIHVEPVSIKPRQEWQQYQHMQTLIN